MVTSNGQNIPGGIKAANGGLLVKTMQEKSMEIIKMLHLIVKTIQKESVQKGEALQIFYS
jgi:hypothetical protein